MNWFGAQAGEGVEFHLLVVSIAVTLLLLGGGRASVDLALAGDRSRG
jgi:putative oxidoreductase